MESIYSEYSELTSLKVFRLNKILDLETNENLIQKRKLASREGIGFGVGIATRTERITEPQQRSRERTLEAANENQCFSQQVTALFQFNERYNNIVISCP